VVKAPGSGRRLARKVESIVILLSIPLPIRCGPCKLIAPKVYELAAQNLDVVFLKLNCNDNNKVG